MDQVKTILKEKTAILDGYARMIPGVNRLSDQHGLNPGMLLGAAIFVKAVLLLLFHGVAVVVTMYTVLIPGLQSIQAIESAGADDDKLWLTYWMIFGFLNVAETFLPFVFWLIPYYDWVRLGFFVWLLQFGGATTFYEKVLRDILAQNKDMIQSFIAKTSASVSNAASNVSKQAADPMNLVKAAGVLNQAKEKVEEFSTPAPINHDDVKVEVQE